MNEFQWFRDMLAWAGENNMEVSVKHDGLERVEIVLAVHQCEHPSVFARGEDAYEGVENPTEHCYVCGRDVPIREL